LSFVAIGPQRQRAGIAPGRTAQANLIDREGSGGQAAARHTVYKDSSIWYR